MEKYVFVEWPESQDFMDHERFGECILCEETENICGSSYMIPLDLYEEVLGIEKAKENDVSSFFYYMWNHWCKEEALTIFPEWLGNHIWSKWLGLCEKNVYGAAENLYAELDDENRDLLVKRAVSLYNGRSRRK